MSETRLMEGLLQLGVLIFSLCLHEFGHAWMANRLGDPTAKMLGRLTIDPRAHVSLVGTILFPALMIAFPGLPLIGWAKPVPVTAENFNHPRRDMSLVAIAGPSMNILLTVLAILILWGLQQVHFLGLDDATLVILLKFLMLFLYMNFFLAVFNLIPIPPLDGGWLLKAVLPGPWAYKLARLEPYSILLFYFLLQLGILNLFFVPAGILLGFALDLFGLGHLTAGLGI